QAVVERIAYDLKFSVEKAQELFEDLKKFLCVAAVSNENTVPPPFIDEAWHSFILFTKDYQLFCEKYFNNFLHHLPHRPEDEPVGAEEVKPTINQVIKMFGSKPSDHWDYINIRLN